MLRISGIVALLVSCTLAVVLFSGVNSLKLAGVAWNDGSPPFHLRLDTGPGSVPQLSWKMPWSLQASVGSDDNHRVVGLTFDDEYYDGLREIPDNARVVVLHRGVEFRRWRWAFGSTVIEWEGRTYVSDRTPARFLGWLGLISASPLLLWLAAALPMTALRGSRKQVTSA